MVAAGALLSACGIMTKPYDGHSATTPTADRVILECHGFCGVIESLDSHRRIDATVQEGLVFLEGTGTVTLDPGRYRVDVLQHGKMVPWDSYAYASVELEAAAGHTYSVEREFEPDWFGSNDRWYGWIEDQATGRVVAGDRPI